MFTALRSDFKARVASVVSVIDPCVGLRGAASVGQ